MPSIPAIASKSVATLSQIRLPPVKLAPKAPPPPPPLADPALS